MPGKTTDTPVTPQAAANRISTLLNAVFSSDRFPVKVDEVALDYTRQRYGEAPISKVRGEDLETIEGMLVRHPSRTKWMIVYNESIASEGRKRFTVAHEFGHYLLHREQQKEFQCGQTDIEVGRGNERSIEQEADLFATNLLMPLDDFRRQVGREPGGFDLFSHCADRYGVSLTAAALRWLDIAEGRAVLVASRDDHMLWAKSNESAFRSGAYFATRKNTIALPDQALAHSANCTGADQSQSTPAQVWFPREPADVELRELTRVAGNYDYTLTLLQMPEVEWRRPRYDEEEPEEDSFDRFVRNGQPPVR